MNNTILKNWHLSILCLTFVAAAILLLPTDSAVAQEARFSYEVDGFNLQLEVLSPLPEGGESYNYGWILNPNSGSNPGSSDHDCVDTIDVISIYDMTGQNVSCTGSNDVSIYQSGFGQLEILLEVNDSEGLISSTTRVVDVGDSIDVADSDGDGLEDGSEDPCPDDSENSCEDGGEGGDDEEDGGNDNGGDGSTDGLVNCGNPGEDGELQESEMCDYQALISMINDILSWLIGILVLVATLLFMYAGILYLTAGGDEIQVETAKEIFGNVAAGFFIVLLAYTLVTTIAGLLVRDDWDSGFNWEEAIPVEINLELDNDNNYV